MSAFKTPLFHIPVAGSGRSSSPFDGVTLDSLTNRELGPAVAHELSARWRSRTPSSDLTGGTVLAGVRWYAAAAMVALGVVMDAEQAKLLFRRLEDNFGQDGLKKILERLHQLCPELAANATGQTSDGDHNPSHPDHRLAMAQLAVMALALRNPALDGLNKILGLNSLSDDPGISRLLAAVPDQLARITIPRDDSMSAWDVLWAPITGHLHDLDQQLLSIHEQWSPWIGDLGETCALAAGALREEQRPRFDGPGETAAFQAPSVAAPNESAQNSEHDKAAASAQHIGDVEVENFTEDQQWMPQVIMLAKNTYVWLHQLSQRYDRPITTLDQIPGEELDRIAAQGITGLWLIGLWQRSSASRDIKKRMGNPEALASAYALDDYAIADDLGGDAALDDLRWKAMERGIRLCGDMVPNHTGVDGRWVIDQPELFMNLDHCPYPAYSFEGPDLSPSPDVEIKLEDHYWDHSDAAVVFRHHDRRQDRTRYIYHGNDGTSMPWNDTAQLDFLNPETREAVIQTILNVTRRFPIIRFDAAMVLARRHVRRLWYPEPGEASDIASRSGYAIPREDFDKAMPLEFWREVVDRIAAEAPDTLLMAEAFWMLEGYFVRTLGMHRVYNSAFMHMLRDQDNAKFRASLRNVIEFDPGILQRFVNFVTNPDEETAEEQFGKGDKYFGICTMLATLPGLPMLGHGQLEGLTEKYGMEYGKSYRDEDPDQGLLEHHERMIFPLFRQRRLFSGARDFRLYDALGPAGETVDDLIAFSNGDGNERVLVVYNNSHETRRGRLDDAFVRPGDPRVRLGDELGLNRMTGMISLCDPRQGDVVCIAADILQREGLDIELPPYGCRVFTEFWAE